MPNTEDRDAWVYDLTDEQLVEQANARGLSIAGNANTIRGRILRFERVGRRGTPPPSPAEDVPVSIAIPTQKEQTAPPPPDPTLAQGEAKDDEYALRKSTRTVRSPPASIPLSRHTDYGLHPPLPPSRPGDYRLGPQRSPDYFDAIPNFEPSNVRGSFPGNGEPPILIPIPQHETQSGAHAISRENSAPSRGQRFLSAGDAYNIMRRWNLKFSGSRTEDIETFLQRIEEGREIMTVADEDILKCLPFFFTDTAPQWYRSKRARWTQWGEFAAAARTRFGNPDFQYALREEILRRTQGEHESAANFLTCLEGLFNRLDQPWSETEQLNYAYRHMLPRLRTYINRGQFNSFDELEKLATMAEINISDAEQYRPPPPREKSVCPDLAYRPPPRSAQASATMTAETSAPRERSGNTGNNRKARDTDSRSTRPANVSFSGTARERRYPNPPAERTDTARGNNIRPDTARRETVRETESRLRPPNRAVTCWNCGMKGHYARGCAQRHRRHCYRCGRSDHTVQTCPNCSGNTSGRS